MPECGFGVGRGRAGFRLESLRRDFCCGLIVKVGCRLLLCEKGGMNLAALGDRLRLGLTFLHVAQLLLDLQGYVFVCLDHGSREVISVLI